MDINQKSVAKENEGMEKGIANGKDDAEMDDRKRV